MTTKRASRPIATYPIAPAGYRMTYGSLRGDPPPHRVVTAVPWSWDTPPKTVAIDEDAFVEFATQCRTEADVERLANRFGFLGTEQDYDAVLDLAGNWPTTTAEPVATWLIQAAALRFHLDFWRELQNPRANVRERTFKLLQFGEFLPPRRQGLLRGAVDEDESGVDPARLPLRLESGTDTGIIGQELDATIEAREAEESARKAFEVTKATLKAATRVARRAPSNLQYGYRTTVRDARHAHKMTTEELRNCRRRRDAAIRKLGWTLLGLSVTAQLRSLHVVPTLVQSGLLPVARARQVGPAPMALEFYAPHLLGLFWLQLATAVSKQVTFRQCRGCGSYLAIHRDGYRSNRWTCSDACRQRASRASRRAPRRARQIARD